MSAARAVTLSMTFGQARAVLKALSQTIDNVQGFKYTELLDIANVYLLLDEAYANAQWGNEQVPTVVIPEQAAGAAPTKGVK